MKRGLILAGAFLLVIGSGLVGCNQDADRFEDVFKLRGLGVISNPVVASPGATVALTFLAAVPLGTTVAAAPYNDAEGSFTMPSAALTLVDGGTNEDHASLRIYKVNATYTVPPAAALNFNGESGFAVVHFGLTLSSGAGDQNMVGDTVVYTAGSAQLAAFNSLPQVTITTPANNSTVGNAKQDIGGTVTPANNETFRIGWFVNGGEIENRNAAITKWDPKGVGKHTFILTARGVQSAAFNYSVSDITVQ